MGEARTLLAAGSSEQAEETLRGAIAAAHERADESAALRGRVELGDLLAATGRESEASALLRDCDAALARLAQAVGQPLPADQAGNRTSHRRV